MDNTRVILNRLLVQLFNHILYLEEKNLREQGVPLTMNEVHTIEAIAKESDATMSVIAKRLMITAGTLSTTVNRLVTRGYVERRRPEQDRRKIYLTLTDTGREIFDVHQDFHHGMVDNIMLEEDIATDKILIQSLEKVMQYFQNNY